MSLRGLRCVEDAQATTPTALVAKPDVAAVMFANATATLEVVRKRLDEAKTIPDVLAVMAMCEAIAGMQRRLNVSKQAKREALLIAVDAEVALGRLCLAMPTAPRGNVSKGTQRPVTKGAYLTQLGVNPTRVSGAQRLAAATPTQVAVAFNSSNTITGIKKALGIHVGSLHVSKSTERDLDYLADEAITMLEGALAGKQLFSGNVKELRSRLARFRVK